MRKFVSLFMMAFSVICIAAFAAESTREDAVEGTWFLTKSVNGKQGAKRPGNLSQMPEGVGFVFPDDGEFRVPGEGAGSERFTIPRGFHFRIEPKSITENGAVADLLLNYTDLKNESEVGFAAENRQVDGRYKMSFDEPYSVTLSLPDIKTEYTLTVQLRRAK